MRYTLQFDSILFQTPRQQQLNVLAAIVSRLFHRQVSVFTKVEITKDKPEAIRSSWTDRLRTGNYWICWEKTGRLSSVYITDWRLLCVELTIWISRQYYSAKTLITVNTDNNSNCFERGQKSPHQKF